MRNLRLFNHTHRLHVHVQSSMTHPTCLYTRPNHSTRPCLYSGQGLSMQCLISSCHLNPCRYGPYVLTSPRVSRCCRPSQFVVMSSKTSPRIAHLIGTSQTSIYPGSIEALAFPCPCCVIYKCRTGIALQPMY